MTKQWRRAMSKRMKQLVKAAEKQGFVVDVTHNSHIRFTSPSGKVVVGDGVNHGETNHHFKRTVARLKEEGFKDD